MSDRIIVMNRGDTYKFTLCIANGLSDIEEDGTVSETERYMMREGDTLFFGLMEPHQRFEDAILKKSYLPADMDSSGYVQIDIKPADTINLEPGVYYYAIKLRHIVDGETTVITVIEKTKFVLND